MAEGLLQLEERKSALVEAAGKELGFERGWLEVAGEEWSEYLGPSVNP